MDTEEATQTDGITDMTNVIRHVKELKQLVMHKAIGLTTGEVVDTSICLKTEGSTVVGLTTLRYAINYGKGLREILGSERYIPGGLNLDVWSHVVGYLGVLLGVDVVFNIYFTNVLNYWEPIWVVREVMTTVNGTFECRTRRCSRRLPPKFVQSTVYGYVLNTTRDLNRSSLKDNTVIPVLATEYDNFTSDTISFYSGFITKIKILLYVLLY